MAPTRESGLASCQMAIVSETRVPAAPGAPSAVATSGWNPTPLVGPVLKALPFALAAALILYMASGVPVRNLASTPVLTRDDIGAHWTIALLGLVLVLTVDAIVAGLALRRGRRPEGTARSGDPRGIPAALRIQSVPGWALLSTAIASGTILAGTAVLGLPLWQMAIGALLPWIPLFALEEVWKYRRYGFYALFLGIALLQVGHLGEHAMQVFQLALSDGDLTRSHGVFGQLDFETVHFVWDSAVWLGGGVLVYRYWDNPWLWASWLVASVHQVEHIYLFWINQFHTDFWARGGIFGIFGQGGLVGSPVSRPYLHFAYNFLVVLPMLFGLWNESRRVRDRIGDV